MVYDAAAGDLEDALDWGRQLQDAVRAEREQADAAAMYLERWAQGEVEETLRRPLRIGQTAKLLHTTVDSLRHWERNGLISVPRNPRNGYRLYGAVEIGRLRVIRMLVRSGYSTMAVLRMMLQFDQGYRGNLRNVLDTPRPDEELLYFTDQWLSTLADMQDHADRAVVLLEAMIHKG
jgi:DNA-binding transcriptional MerR regulator